MHGTRQCWFVKSISILGCRRSICICVASWDAKESRSSRPLRLVSTGTQIRLTSVATHEMLWVEFIFWYPSVLGSRFCETDAQLTFRRKRAVKAVGVALLQASMVTSNQSARWNLLKNGIFFKLNLNQVSTCNWASDSPSLTLPQRYSGNNHWGRSYSELTQSRLFWYFEIPSGKGP